MCDYARVINFRIIIIIIILFFGPPAQSLLLFIAVLSGRVRRNFVKQAHKVIICWQWGLYSEFLRNLLVLQHIAMLVQGVLKLKPYKYKDLWNVLSTPLYVNSSSRKADNQTGCFMGVSVLSATHINSAWPFIRGLAQLLLFFITPLRHHKHNTIIHSTCTLCPDKVNPTQCTTEMWNLNASCVNFVRFILKYYVKCAQNFFW